MAYRVLPVIACLFSPALSFAEDDTAPSGEALYAQACAACHGPSLDAAEGGGDLRAFEGDYQAFRAIVLDGRGAMPPTLLSEAEVERIWAFIGVQAERP